jgi:Ca2+-binding RTX toxin-like protein
MRPRALLAAALVALALPSAAHGATASVTDGTLTYTGAPGERNDVGIQQQPNGYLLQDNLARISAGPGCVVTTDNYGNDAARCTGAAAISVRLGDAGDTLRPIGPLAAPVTYSGGAGHDVIVYPGLTGPIAASNDGAADDGPTGRDDIGTDVEVVFGGSFADRLSAGPLGADLHPGAGDDTLIGGDGDDTLRAAYVEDVGLESGTFYAQGRDTVTCGRGDDFVLSDRSDDVARDCEVVAVDTDRGFRVKGSRRDDAIGPLPYGWGPTTTWASRGDDTIRTAEMTRVYAGRGNDRIIGFDQAAQTFYGERGNDRIDVRDTPARKYNRDTVRCGRGRDVVYANRGDRIGRDCERVSRRG